MSKESENQAYARGYAAGRKRQQSDEVKASVRAGQVAFWEKAVLAVAPYFMGCEAWVRGEKKLTGLEDRADLAVKFANYVTAQRPKE
ncbi:hypothetical protein [Luteibacter sp. SG786]|uniref:hypothetical protein n=1 Tax=Luteibacter sp. SG786 TaxID=2587130 RepID=UPI001423538F|nr:hypothetical protein [Luteibacter sp. SG786]NII53544.1 hypothetical protein [Luteibacter sp. SG786]